MPTGHALAGYTALIERYSLAVFPLTQEARIASVTSRSQQEEYGQLVEFFPRRYQPGSATCAQLEFALKYERLNLTILRLVFDRLSEAEITAYIAARPTSPVLRRMWFLSEWLTGRGLPLPDLQRQAYVDVLDRHDYYTREPGTRCRRYGIRNNLLGTRDFCPIVYRTPVLQQFEEKDFTGQGQLALEACAPSMLERVLTSLYLGETKASFAIEQEIPSLDRSRRFMALLQQAEHRDFASHAGLREVQNTIVESHAQDQTYRSHQTFVGQSSFQGEIVDLVPARPQDIASLMTGLLNAHHLMGSHEVSLVIHAAAIAYGFVFVHPFTDGNGRAHRFLVHNILAQRGYTPPGLIFPVSACMQKQPEAYLQSLNAISRHLTRLSDYTFDPAGHMTVHNDTALYFCYLDMTTQAEALYHFIETTIQTELIEGRDYLVHFDQAKRAITQYVDMPDRKVNLFITLCVQN